jgi:hypothetical protein
MTSNEEVDIQKAEKLKNRLIWTPMTKLFPNIFDYCYRRKIQKAGRCDLVDGPIAGKIVLPFPPIGIPLFWFTSNRDGFFPSYKKILDGKYPLCPSITKRKICIDQIQRAADIFLQHNIKNEDIEICRSISIERKTWFKENILNLMNILKDPILLDNSDGILTEYKYVELNIRTSLFYQLYTQEAERIILLRKISNTFLDSSNTLPTVLNTVISEYTY